MKVADIQDDKIRAEAQELVSNLRKTADKLEDAWTRENISLAAKIFQTAADGFTELAAHPDPFPGEEQKHT